MCCGPTALPCAAAPPPCHAQVDEGALGEAGRNWPRPPAPQLNPATDKLGAWCAAAWERSRVCLCFFWLLLAGCLLAEPWAGEWGAAERQPPSTAALHTLHPSHPYPPLAKQPRRRPTHPPPTVFQQLEVDYAFQAPHQRFYAGGADLREAPVVRLYGVTEGGSSVAAFVHGFEPYFFVEAPTPSFSPDDCASLTTELNVRAGQGRGDWGVPAPTACCGCCLLLLQVLPASAAWIEAPRPCPPAPTLQPLPN